MNARNPGASRLLLTLALVPVLTVGCYTRLTTDKEAINYRDSNGDVIESESAKAILAPEYNRVLAELGIEISEYRMQPGTRISVEVYGHSISTSVNIRPDGKVDLPLIGDVMAMDRTVTELKGEISTRYSEYFIDAPQVIINTVSTEEDNTVRGGDVTVLNTGGGQGVVNLTGDERLSEVLARVRALHKKAEWNEVAVIRASRKTNDRYIVICDIERLVRYGDVDQDIAMRNGDIVFVPIEKNTLLEEIFATLGVLANHVEDHQTLIDYVERLEAY